ncbi:hypothetical protein Tco_1052691 [Tanacetum coccineum]
MDESSNPKPQTPPQQQSSSLPESSGSPIHLDHAPSVDFNIDAITLKTNNEVALLYPDNPNKDTFLCVSDFISKCWGVSGDVGLNFFRKAIGANYLRHPDDYAQTSTIETVKYWFPYIEYSRVVEAT